MLCPVCNGLEQLAVQCPSCAAQSADYGRSVDFTAPYAPYQPDIDEAAMTLSDVDPAVSSCSHVACCPSCGAVFEIYVRKWR